MRALAGLSNLHAKLTFIPTGSAEQYPCQDLHEACHEVIEAFSPDRCVWGSNFPCELWCPEITYAQHLRIFTHELGLDEETKKAVLGGTAARLWF
jgi:predicted TIM-barrel fold metal-dependent hydrolase